MNNAQRILLTTYLSFTLLILIFRTLYHDNEAAVYLMFAVRIAMFLTVLFMFKRFKEQKLIVLAFFFTVVSDYFFVYAKLFTPPMATRELYGMVGFIAAYVCLLAAFHKNFKPGKKDLFTAIPFLIVFAYIFMSLSPYAKGFMLPAAIVVGIVLCFAGITMVATVYRGYFLKSVAWFIAIAGSMLFISDMFVAYSIFHPAFKGFILWKELLIWGTYVPAWTLLMLVVAQEEIYVKNEKADKAPRLG